MQILGFPFTGIDFLASGLSIGVPAWYGTDIDTKIATITAHDR